MPYPNTRREMDTFFGHIKDIQAIPNAVARNQAIDSFFSALLSNSRKLERLYEVFSRVPTDNQYHQLLIYCTFKVLLEENGVATEQAEKLYTIFNKDINKIKNYLCDFAATYKKLNSHQPMHDACNFAIPPKGSQYTAEVWADLSAKYLTELPFRKLLAQAPDIEELITTQAQAIPYANRASKTAISELTEEIKTLNRSIKIQKSQESELTDEEEIQIQEAVKTLMEKQTQLTTMRIPFNKELTLTALTAFRERYILQVSPSYRQFLENGLTKKNYEKFINLERQDSNELIPPLRIDGGSGYYLMKVPVLDEAHAARAAYFGKLTDCCQSLSGELGEPCVIHGLTSPNGGFYVICHGDVNNPQITDEVLGQSWVWRGKKNELVFDSIEITDEKTGIYENKTQIVKNLIHQAAQQLITHSNIDRVLCGATSGISKEVGITTPFEIAQFIDYTGYCDSKNQLILRDKYRPFYFFGATQEDTQKTKQWIVAKLKSNTPLTNAGSLWEAINWAFLSKNMHLIQEILNLASQKNIQRSQEINILINNLNEYMQYGLTPKISSLIKKRRFPLEARDAYGNPPLIQAIYINTPNNIQNAKTLIEYGANIGSAALMYAAQYGNIDIFKILIQKVDPNQADNNGKTALMYAAQYGNINICMELIQKVDLNQADNNGQTALMYAAQYGNINICMELIQKVDLNQADNNGQTAFMYAVQYGYTDICMELIQKVDLNQVDDNGQTAFMYAAQYGNINICMELIQKVDLNQVDDNGKTALIYAIEFGNTKIAKKLIKNNADLNKADDDGKTALIYAITSGNTEIAKKLIKNNADLNKTNNNGKTALMYAIESGNTEIAKKLIKNNADLNKTNNNGKTALMYAAQYENIDICRILIQKMDPNQANNNGETALTYAKDTRNNETISMIEDRLALIKANETIEPILFSEETKVETASPGPTLPQQESKYTLETKAEDTEPPVVIRHNRRE